MTYTQDKHKIELYLTCDLYDRLCEGATFTGYRDDLEQYIIMLIAERC